ncbi:unnamed protein product [Chironomus riparius]|uniref:von Hippel-Lindau disease tumour suppressor beta domain-containing protein n=1 Tax=Chironomus riparius TaxID=315576 RepID=A0A9N9S8K7_9DIPT|nr:unnamed protein product [Chironomus riparius]
MLRSRESNIRAFVKFINCSPRKIEVHWINYRGKNVHYSTLEPSASVVVNTFVTHPWICLCPDTGQRMCINNNEVFLGKPWFNFITNSEDGLVSVERQDANIHLPMRSLREIGLWKVLFLVRTRSDIIALEIPKTLKADLLHQFFLSTRYKEVEVVDDDDGDGR